MIVENEKPWLFLKAAFLAGFMSSAEGWNGEYPFNGNKASAWEGGVSERFDLWRETGEALSERLVKKAASGVNMVQLENADAKPFVETIRYSLGNECEQDVCGLSEKIKSTARELEAIGCTDAEIRLACLALCGVPTAPLRITTMGISS